MLSKLQSGKKAVGQKQTLRAVRDNRALEVFVAQDASERISAPVLALCAETGVAVTKVPTMAELGSACGIQTDAAAAALLK